MTYLLTFLVAFNIAGFTVMPLLVSKRNPLLWIMPVPGLHRFFLVIELWLAAAVLPPEYNFLFVFSAICILNLIFDFRYVAKKVLSGQLPKLMLFQSISSDLAIFRSIEFEDEGAVDFSIYLSEDSRIIADIAMTALIFVIIF